MLIISVSFKSSSHVKYCCLVAKVNGVYKLMWVLLCVTCNSVEIICVAYFTLISWAVIPSVVRVGCYVLKTVTPSET